MTAESLSRMAIAIYRLRSRTSRDQHCQRARRKSNFIGGAGSVPSSR